MCGTCGCTQKKIMRLELDVLAKNDLFAARNRADFASARITAFNLVSSPGSGKTTLLERTIRDLGSTARVSVLEGDQETARDADRIRKTGAPVVQINTGTGCHLDAAMVAGGVRELSPPRDSILMIENVGNLVCPALFDLGELAKVVLFSVTEGDDKPLKYPHMFRASELVIINKIDLLPYVSFDLERAKINARAVNPGIEVISISATRGEGLENWYRWIQHKRGKNDRTDSRKAADRSEKSHQNRV